MALRVSVPFKMSKLRFDYFELHRQSIGLLRRLKLDLDIDYIKFFGGRYIENESPLPYLGGWAIVVSRPLSHGPFSQSTMLLWCQHPHLTNSNRPRQAQRRWQRSLVLQTREASCCTRRPRSWESISARRASYLRSSWSPVSFA